MTAAEQVREFHEKFGLPTAATPRRIASQPAWRRHRLLTSEVAELQDAVAEGELPGIAQELADCVYVLYGTALTYGIDLDAVIAAVHAANMTKMGANGRPILVNGKVQKGPNYVRPDVAAVLARQEAPGPYGGRGTGPDHRLTVSMSALGEIGGPHVLYRLDHPAECDRLPYGQRCELDTGARRGWPEQVGEFTISAWWAKDWTDQGWEYDAGVDWAPVETEEAAR
jgi:predicted HAD superfamily Cof-like phosphohydrolase